jgi:hypothetical protein
MDYLEIVLQGCFNVNNRAFLEKYFLREYKKAEKEQFFEANEFFSGCLRVIENWEKHLQNKVHERKRELYLMLKEVRNGTLLMVFDNAEGKTTEQQRQEAIEYCEQELKELSEIGLHSFSVYLPAVTNGRIFGNMTYDEVLQIKIAILKAYQKTQPSVEQIPPQPISINESRTKKVIFETINNIDKQGWQYAFISEQDYNLFTDLLTNFFEYKPYTLPDTTIQLKRTCKTKVAKALGEIHKELSNENKLSTDTEYFKIIRVFSHFKNETEGDLYKALTR